MVKHYISSSIPDSFYIHLTSKTTSTKYYQVLCELFENWSIAITVEKRCQLGELGACGPISACRDDKGQVDSCFLPHKQPPCMPYFSVSCENWVIRLWWPHNSSMTWITGGRPSQAMFSSLASPFWLKAWIALAGAGTGSSTLGSAGIIVLLWRYEWNVFYLAVQQWKHVFYRVTHVQTICFPLWSRLLPPGWWHCFLIVIAIWHMAIRWISAIVLGFRTAPSLWGEMWILCCKMSFHDFCKVGNTGFNSASSGLFN